jgi:hypothetical protein
VVGTTFGHEREDFTLAFTQLVERVVGALAVEDAAGDRGPRRADGRAARLHLRPGDLANRFDVLWVMRQVGHADSHMTMDVYAQLQQRAERQHGEAFDGLVRQARERLYGTVEDAHTPPPEPGVPNIVDAWRNESQEP